MADTLTAAETEQLYEELAVAIDRVAPEQEALFLGKLALLLAVEVGAVGRVSALIDSALEDL